MGAEGVGADWTIFETPFGRPLALARLEGVLFAETVVAEIVF